MNKTHRFLAFDCGATSGRALLGTFSGGVFSMEEVCRFPNRPLKRDGRLYWDLDSMRRSFMDCLTDLGSRGIKLDSIGIDTWGVDFGCIAPDGSLAGLPRAYRDPYTRGIPEEVFKIVPRTELYAATGIQIMDFNTIFQLYAQTRTGEPALEKAAGILFMPDLLAWTLTGRQVCEYTDASTSGMMDQKTRSFDKGLLERLGIRTDVLLPIVQPGMSDSASLDNVLEFLVMSGLSLPHAMRHHPLPQEHHRNVAPGAVPRSLAQAGERLFIYLPRAYGAQRRGFPGPHQSRRPPLRRAGEYGGGDPSLRSG